MKIYMHYTLRMLGCTVLLAFLAGCTEPSPARNALSENKTTAECLADEACQETVLNRIETRMGTLEYQAGFPAEATVERIYDEMVLVMLL